MIINRQNLATLATVYDAAFRAAFTGWQAQSMYEQVAMTTMSTTASNLYPWLGKLPSMREWLGERVAQNLTEHSFEIRNRDFELTVGVDRNAIEDDQYGVYMPQFAHMGEASAAHPDELVWPLLKAGHSTKCYDGKNFFAEDHAVKGVGKVSNWYKKGNAAPKWYLMDLSRSAMKPIIFQQRKPGDMIVRLDREEDENVFNRREFLYGIHCRDNVGFGLWQLAAASSEDLTATNFAKVYQGMEGMKGDEGRPLGLRPTHLVVAPALRETGTKLLKNELGANGETNTVKDWAELMVVPWLA
ncbi:Mu-like prophage major head subunit gpT family protein [Ruegeria sp.]|uniref:Mu-like prophage major head subunit gpT family protein n=1 Tax=Ruegeria sp. TaxID=1879320 RepID=UPI003B5AFEC7